MEKIIKVLRAKQKALSKQYDECLGEQDDEEESIWSAEVGAKLEIVEELLDKFDKKKK